MSEDLELVRGNDNPFENVRLPEADAKLIKADLAAEIVSILRERRLTGAAAAKLAGRPPDGGYVPHPQCRPVPLYH